MKTPEEWSKDWHEISNHEVFVNIMSSRDCEKLFLDWIKRVQDDARGELTEVYEVKIEHLPRGMWRLHYDNGVSPKSFYDRLIVFKDAIAHTCYYGNETVYKIAGTVPHKSVDNSLGDDPS